MARGRMLNKNICESDSFALLRDSNSQLLCCLLTSWWDDHGKMIGDEEWIRGNITRKLKQFTLKEIGRCLKNINDNTDVQWWQDDKGNKWLYWPTFNNHQTISDEKKTIDKLPSPKIPKNPQESDGEHPQQYKEKFNIKYKEECASVSEFFSYFLLKTKKAFKLTPDCVRLIQLRLEGGYTLEQLKKAVDNFVADTWQGRAERLDLIYCIGKQKGKPDNLEKWLNMPEQKKPCKPSNIMTKEQIEEWKKEKRFIGGEIGGHK